MSRRVDAWDALEIAGAVAVTIGSGVVWLLPPVGVPLIVGGGFALWFGGWRRP